MLLLIIPAAVLTYLALRYKVLNNYRRLKRDEYSIKHGYEWRLMALANIPSGILLSIAAGALHKPILMFSLIALSSGIMIACFLWLFFDSWLNGLRGFTRFSIGSNEGRKDPVTDRILKPFSEFMRAVIKIALVLASIFFYILMMLWQIS